MMKVVLRELIDAFLGFMFLDDSCQWMIGKTI